MPGDPTNGATCRFVWRGRPSSPCKRGSRTTGNRPPASSSRAKPYYPELVGRGPLAVQTLLSSPETGASNVRTMYYLSIVCARESIYIANPYFVPDPVAHRDVD